MQQTAPRSSLSNRYPVMPYRGVSGLGAGLDQQIMMWGGVASPVVSSLAAPAVSTALGLTAGSSLAVPIAGAAFAAILMGVELILHSGCGQTCVVTSQWANQAADLLEQNIQKYFSLPAPRTTNDQQSALNIFDAIWAGLVQRCSQAGLGTAGQNCIDDRKAGACKWHQTGQPEFPGQPAYGECWNWFKAYRDPIANDHVVSPVTQISNLFPTVGGGSSLWLFAGGALLLLGLAGGN